MPTIIYVHDVHDFHVDGVQVCQCLYTSISYTQLLHENICYIYQPPLPLLRPLSQVLQSSGIRPKLLSFSSARFGGTALTILL
jgi:hypothetical protein